MEVEIDIEKLRQDLLNYYGPGSMFNPAMKIIVDQILSASPEQLLEIANNSSSIDIRDYIIDNHIKF